MPRPGFVLDVDKSTPPILFHHGENFRLEKLPAGRSRVIYPAEPHPGIDDVDGAIRHALLQPARRVRAAPRPAAPRHEADHLLRRRVAAAPPDAPPDIRQRIIEAVLDLAAAGRGRRRAHHRRARAPPAHDRARAPPRRRRPGVRRLRPQRPALQPRRRGPRQPRCCWAPPTGAKRSRSTGAPPRATSLVYVNINLVSMDGGHKCTATGLASYRSIRHHHNVATMQKSTSFMDRHKSELHSSNWRMGEVIRKAGVKIFQIEIHAEQRHLRHRGPAVGAAEARVGVEPPRPGLVHGHEGRPRPHAHLGVAEASSTRGGHPSASPRSTPARSTRSTRRPWRRCTASSWSRSRARPTSSPWACPTSAPTT